LFGWPLAHRARTRGADHNRTTIWGHGGYLPGFRSILWFEPSRDAVIVVLVNDARVEPRDLAELAMRRLPVRAH
jgi:CubicO group peptidase (beta-lactamase class C family)